MQLKLLAFMAALFLVPEVYAPICGLDIKTSVPGAKVYVDGEYVGESPVVHIIYSPGLVKLRVEKEGYVTWEDYVDVPWNDIAEVKIDLEPIAKETPAPVNPEAKPERRGICGPTALLAVALLPLSARRFLKKKRGRT